MKYQGTITRVQRARGGVTLIVETEMGLRGVELDNDVWQEIVADFHIGQADQVIGWQVEYDPAHGDLEIVGPVEEAVDEDAVDDDTIAVQQDGHNDRDDEWQE